MVQLKALAVLVALFALGMVLLPRVVDRPRDGGGFVGNAEENLRKIREDYDKITNARRRPKVDLYEDIGNEMSKVSKIHKPESLSIHVTRYNESGDKKKYSLIGKLFISGRTYNSKAVGWDLVQTNKDLVQALGSQVKDEKDSHVSRRRKTKS